MTFDLARARAETRGCAEVTHLNHAGASLMPAPVADAVIDWLREEELTGGYETANRHRGRLEHFYDATAKLLNCHRDEVAFVENATRAWDMAFYALDLGPGDRILTADRHVSRVEAEADIAAFEHHLDVVLGFYDRLDM